MSKNYMDNHLESKAIENAMLILRRFWLALFLILLLILTVASALFSEEFELYRDIEHLVYRKNPTILLVLAFAALIAVMACWDHGHKRRSPVGSNKRVDELCIMGIAMAWSLFFLLTLKSQPYMDCMSVVEIANQFNRGDFSALTTPTHDSYLYIYSFQIGYVGFLQILFKLFGENHYFAAQLANVVAVIFLVRNVHELSELAYEDRRVGRLSDLLMAFCLPLYIDVTFVYGDVIGWSFAIGALLCTMRWAQSGEVKRLLAAGTLIAVGVQFKTNVYIYLIAIVIIIIMESLRRHLWKPVLMIALMLLITVGLGKAIQTGYAAYVGIEEFPPGTPSTCWIAMSMLEDENFENGWYNGYNIETFKASGYDPVIADEMARETIRERIGDFASYPRGAVKFFLVKFVSAWNDPQFNSQIKMEWGSRHVENLPGIAYWMIYEGGRAVLFWMMNFLHFIIFAGATVGTAIALCKKDEQARRTAYLVLPVLGGMMFHILWETQARYMIGYYVLLFPVAAAGLIQLVTFSGNLLPGSHTKNYSETKSS